jgi:hypothetical protein
MFSEGRDVRTSRPATARVGIGRRAERLKYGPSKVSRGLFDDYDRILGMLENLRLRILEQSDDAE